MIKHLVGDNTPDEEEEQPAPKKVADPPKQLVVKPIVQKAQKPADSKANKTVEIKKKVILPPPKKQIMIKKIDKKPENKMIKASKEYMPA